MWQPGDVLLLPSNGQISPMITPCHTALINKFGMNPFVDAIQKKSIPPQALALNPNDDQRLISGDYAHAGVYNGVRVIFYRLDKNQNSLSVLWAMVVNINEYVLKPSRGYGCKRIIISTETLLFENIEKLERLFREYISNLSNIETVFK